MSDHDNSDDGSLVPAGRRDLALLVADNPLVSRGLADMATGAELPDAHPFDVESSTAYKVYMRRLELLLRLRDLRSAEQAKILPNEQESTANSEAIKEPTDPT